MSSQLLIHNIVFLVGGVLNIILPIAVLFIRRNKLDTLVVTFALMSLSVATFEISHVMGANASDPEASRSIFMFNLSVIFINMFMTHWFLALIGKTKERRKALLAVYASGITLFLIHIIFPETYLVASVPKLYFPYYYEPGSLQWVTRVWFNIVGVYYFMELFLAHRAEKDPIKRNRYLYVLIAILYGFIVGSTAIFLVYDIEFNPVWSSFFGLYCLIIAYAVVRYQLLDVRVIIQRAFVYALSVAVLIGFISFSNSLNVLMQNYIPGFPSWLVPLMFSITGVAIAVAIWHKLREGDHMKYEFITIVAHKFRTPLTQTRWSTEELLNMEHDPDKTKHLKHIEESNIKLINLTGTLIALSDADQMMETQYSFKQQSICELLHEVAQSFKDQYLRKNISLNVLCPADDVAVYIDSDRIKFVLQTLLENALSYTPAGGRVDAEIKTSGSRVTLSVKDTGIGISENDLPMIFSRFYRTHKARLADTEGFGVGLYLSKAVLKRHAGNIEVNSAGEGKGSTFTITLPRA